jgi:hypothetical protein
MPWWLRHWLLLTTIGLIVLLVYAAAAITVLPTWVVSWSAATVEDKDRLSAIVNTRGALLGVLGPALIGLGALAAFLNYRVASESLRQAALQNERTYELSRRELATDRFTKAIEQLGSTELAVRVGGIYALEQLALESRRDVAPRSRYHYMIIEILTGFLRDQTPDPSRREDMEGTPQSLKADLQAAATVIGRRDVSHDPEGFRLDLRGVPLDNVDFADAKLQRAIFTGAQLKGAEFGDAQLQETIFQDAKLQNANFAFAKLQDTAFNNAEVQGAHFMRDQLEETNLTDAQVRSAAVLAGALAAAPRRVREIDADRISKA